MIGDLIRRFIKNVDNLALIEEQDLVNFKNSQVEENYHLEFKGKQFLTGQEKKIGKAISGFSNSDGGLLILGLSETKETDNKPPRPDNFEPIEKITREGLEQRLMSAVGP